MRALIPLLLLTIGCGTIGCNPEVTPSPKWEGSFCDANDEGVVCEGVLYKYGSEEFKKKLWITNQKGMFCLWNQFVNNASEWKDPEKKCEWTEPTTE